MMQTLPNNQPHPVATPEPAAFRVGDRVRTEILGFAGTVMEVSSDCVGVQLDAASGLYKYRPDQLRHVAPAAPAAEQGAEPYRLEDRGDHWGVVVRRNGICVLGLSKNGNGHSGDRWSRKDAEAVVSTMNRRPNLSPSEREAADALAEAARFTVAEIEAWFCNWNAYSMPRMRKDFVRVLGRLREAVAADHAASKPAPPVTVGETYRERARKVVDDNKAHDIAKAFLEMSVAAPVPPDLEARLVAAVEGLEEPRVANMGKRTPAELMAFKAGFLATRHFALAALRSVLASASGSPVPVKYSPAPIETMATNIDYFAGVVQSGDYGSLPPSTVAGVLRQYAAQLRDSERDKVARPLPAPAPRVETPAEEDRGHDERRDVPAAHA